MRILQSGWMRAHFSKWFETLCTKLWKKIPAFSKKLLIFHSELVLI